MGDVASVVKNLCGSGDCCKYVLNSASFHSQCCTEESHGCDCDCETREVPLAQEADIEMSVEEEACCNLLFSRHNK